MADINFFRSIDFDVCQPQNRAVLKESLIFQKNKIKQKKEMEIRKVEKIQK